jgi:hypothetical protein
MAAQYVAMIRAEDDLHVVVPEQFISAPLTLPMVEDAAIFAAGAHDYSTIAYTRMPPWLPLYFIVR